MPSSRLPPDALYLRDGVSHPRHLIPNWSPLKCELSIDLIHAVLKEKKRMDKFSLFNYLRFCCGIPIYELLSEIRLSQPDVMKKALSEIAEVENEVLTYRENCQRPLSISAGPVEDISSILKSMMDWYGPDRADGIVKMCEVNFQIELTQESLNELFSSNYTSRDEILLNAYTHKVLSNDDGKRPKSAKEAFEERLFAVLKDTVRSLVQRLKHLSEARLQEEIFAKYHGFILDRIMVAIIYEVHSLDLDPERMYKAAFEEFAVVMCDAKHGLFFFSKEYATENINSIFDESHTSLPHPCEHVFLHDGSVGNLQPGAELPCSWLTFETRTIADAAERIRKFEWSLVELVILSVGEFALRTDKYATVRSVFGEVKQLIKAIRAVTSKTCKIELWSLPIHPNPEKVDPKAKELNSMYEAIS